MASKFAPIDEEKDEPYTNSCQETALQLIGLQVPLQQACLHV